MKRNLILVAGGVLLATVIIYRMYNKKHRSVDDEQAVNATATELFRHYEADEAAANEMYLDKVVAVSGVIDHVTTNQSGNMIIVLTTGNPPFGVSCTMERNELKVRSGMEATIKGICRGYLSDVILTDARLISK
jgi:hypothetical protein